MGLAGLQSFRFPMIRGSTSVPIAYHESIHVCAQHLGDLFISLRSYFSTTKYGNCKSHVLCHKSHNPNQAMAAFKIIQMGVNLFRNWGCSNPPKMLPPKTPLQKTPQKTPQTSWGPMCRCVEVRCFRGQQFKYRLSSQNWDFTWFQHQITNKNWLK